MKKLLSRLTRHDRQWLSTDEVEHRLTPGAGKQMFCELRRPPCGEQARKRLGVYSLVSVISSAMRARALDQSRSAVRSETSSASAVSEVVSPAK